MNENVKSTDDILDGKIRAQPDSEEFQEAEEDSRVTEEPEEVSEDMGPKKKKAKKESKKIETEEQETEEVVVPLRKKPRISDEDAAARLASLADQIKNNIRAGDETKDDEPKKKKQKPLKVRILELFTADFLTVCYTRVVKKLQNGCDRDRSLV